jgi:carboxymethylenebutenolidase
MCHPDPVNGATRVPEAKERRFTVESGGVAVPVFEAAPYGPSRGNVIIIHDIHGANQFYHDLARRYAGAGYSAYLPDLFVRQGPLPEATREAAFARRAHLSDPQAMDDLKRLVDVLKEHSSGRIAAVGFCMGGTYVMLLAAREPRLAGGVIYYGFPALAETSALRPWEPLQETAAVGMPLIGFWGDQDHGVGMDNVASYEQGLRAAGKPFDFTIYPGLPHGFLTFDPTSPHYEASQDSWRKTLDFFQSRLD